MILKRKKKYNIPESFNFEEARELFRNPTVDTDRE